MSVPRVPSDCPRQVCAVCALRCRTNKLEVVNISQHIFTTFNVIWLSSRSPLSGLTLNQNNRRKHATRLSRPANVTVGYTSINNSYAKDWALKNVRVRMFSQTGVERSLSAYRTQISQLFVIIGSLHNERRLLMLNAFLDFRLRVRYALQATFSSHKPTHNVVFLVPKQRDRQIYNRSQPKKKKRKTSSAHGLRCLAWIEFAQVFHPITPTTFTA